MMIPLLSLALAASTTAAPAPKPTAADAPACKEDARWNDPAPPQRIHANVWFVGTCGLSSLLVTGDQGHILIDGATEKAAPLIEANIRQLGFRLEDVRILVNSHGHFDHAGGLAQLQRDSGATVFARGDDADAIERGHGSRSDPQFRSAGPFPPATQVQRVVDGQVLAVGALRLTAHATPGHTPGGTSWTWRSCEGERCLDFAYVDSLTALTDDEYRYSDHADALAAMRATLRKVAALPCEVLVTPHPDSSDLWQRIGTRATQPLVDASACRRYAEQAEANLERQLAKEKSAGKSASAYSAAERGKSP